MCGICGYFSRDGLGQDDFTVVRKMNDALIHRGPDSFGEYFDDNIAIAMRRLKIIDLVGGDQPLFNEDKSLVFIGNGEIYNYKELRDDLKLAGHKFSSNTDMEVILHLYEDKGEECLEYLRGMFTFCIFDKKENKVFVARDRLGEKPLYFYHQNEKFLFSSELRSLYKSGVVPFQFDLTAVNDFFHYGYVPEPQTPIKNLMKLKAGHYIVGDLNKFSFKETCYWKMEDSEPIEGNPEDIVRKELDVISEIIVRSDVPVGIALSGGLDSSAILALVNEKYPGKLQAFCVGYEERTKSDEREDAKKLADELDIPFHNIELRTDDMVDFFSELVWLTDDPIADISGYSYYSIMKKASEEGVKVMLQGQGGDELFFGYGWLRGSAKYSEKKYELLNKGKATVFDFFELKLPSFNIDSIYGFIKTSGGYKDAKKRYELFKTRPSDELIFVNTSRSFNNANIILNKYYADEMVAELKDLPGPNRHFTFDMPWNHIDVLITKAISETYLLENGMAQGDRLSMASSVELRLPLVDFKLYEKAIGLRKNYKDYLLKPKQWLVGAVEDILPKEVLSRRKKGFEPPVYKWHKAIKDKYVKLLNDGVLINEKIFSKSGVDELISEEIDREVPVPIIYKALILEIWSRKLLGRSVE